MERFILSRVSETSGVTCCSQAAGVVVYPAGLPRYTFRGGVSVNEPPTRAVITDAAHAVRMAVDAFNSLPSEARANRNGPDTIEFDWCESEGVCNVIFRD